MIYVLFVIVIGFQLINFLKLKKMSKTDAQAVSALQAVVTQLGNIDTAIKSLIAAQQNNAGNIPDDLSAAIDSVVAASQTAATDAGTN